MKKGDKVPIARTKEIGHYVDAKAVVIGEELCLMR